MSKLKYYVKFTQVKSNFNYSVSVLKYLSTSLYIITDNVVILKLP